MYEFHIPIKYEGSVLVRIPEDLSEQHAQALAQHVALSRILATLETLDTPEDEAFLSWVDECERLGTELDDRLWDAARDSCELEAGVWTTNGKEGGC